MATGRLPDPNSAPVTAKGDLYTYSTVPAKLAVGNNGDTLLADSASSVGLRWQSAYNGNSCVNGGMDFWQRGTSAAGGYPTYLADRWMNYRSTTGSTFSRQNTSDTTNLPTIQYCQRIARDSGNTNTSAIYISQSLESEESRRFVGQTVTLSWYARAGANFSAASSNMNFELLYGTGTNQNVIAGFTGQTNVSSGTKTLTTTWQRFSTTATVNASATQLGINLFFIPVGTAGANDWMEITGVQLELGSVATTFKRAGNTLQGELAACQRYYQRYESSASYAPFGTGYIFSTTQTIHSLPFQVRLRGNPSVSFSAGNTFAAYTASGTVTAATGIGTDRVGTNSLMFTLTAATGVANGQGCFCIANAGAAAYIEVNSEL